MNEKAILKIQIGNNSVLNFNHNYELSEDYLSRIHNMDLVRREDTNYVEDEEYEHDKRLEDGDVEK